MKASRASIKNLKKLRELDERMVRFEAQLAAVNAKLDTLLARIVYSASSDETGPEVRPDEPFEEFKDMVDYLEPEQLVVAD